MKLYKDIFSDDELFSDAYEQEELYNGTIIKVTSKFIEKKTNENISVYDGNAFGGGEQDQEGGAPSEEKVMVNAVVDAHELQETFFNDKKEYMSLIKKYMKRLLDEVKKNTPDRVNDFQKGAQEFVKQVLANFKDYQFYTGRSYDTDAMIVLQKFSDDGKTPYLFFWKDGLKEEKY